MGSYYGQKKYIYRIFPDYGQDWEGNSVTDGKGNTIISGCFTTKNSSIGHYIEKIDISGNPTWFKYLVDGQQNFIERIGINKENHVGAILNFNNYNNSNLIVRSFFSGVLIPNDSLSFAKLFNRDTSLFGRHMASL